MVTNGDIIQKQYSGESFIVLQTGVHINGRSLMRNYLLKVVIATTVLQFAGHAANSQKKKQESLLGKTDIHALIEAAPLVPSSVTDAVTRAYGADIINGSPTRLTDFYRPFYDKVESAEKQFQLVYGNKMQQFYVQQGEKGVRKNLTAEVNRNPVMSRMGGVEKVSKMDENEAERAAREAAADYMKSPGGSGGNQIPGMNAMMQKYMNDKEYAARFDKMSDKEKEAEMKKFMDAEMKGGSTAVMPANHNQFEKEMAGKNKIMTAMQIDQAIAEMQQQLNQLLSVFENNVKALKTSSGNHEEIEEAHRKAFKKIPLVVMGEGHVEDPAKVQELMLKTVAKHRARNDYELSQIRLWYNDLKAKYKLVVNDYNDLLMKYSKGINSSMKDVYNGSNTELTLAGFEMGLIGAAGTLGKKSENATEETARMERTQYLRSLAR